MFPLPGAQVQSLVRELRARKWSCMINKQINQQINNKSRDLRVRKKRLSCISDPLIYSAFSQEERLQDIIVFLMT